MGGRLGVFTDILPTTVTIFSLLAWTANSSVPQNTTQRKTKVYSAGYVQCRGKPQSQTGKWDSKKALIVSYMPVRLHHSDEIWHGKDLIRLVPPTASEARTFASIKHSTFTNYAVLHRQGPQSFPSCVFIFSKLFVLQLPSSAILCRRWIIHVMYLRQIHH